MYLLEIRWSKILEEVKKPKPKSLFRHFAKTRRLKLNHLKIFCILVGIHEETN